MEKRAKGWVLRSQIDHNKLTACGISDSIVEHVLLPKVQGNLLPWVEQFGGINPMITDFFEYKVTNYVKFANLNWDERSSL